VQPGQDDDDFVAGVGGLADEPRVVARLARLDVADDETPPVPPSLALGVLKKPEDVVCRLVERVDGLHGHLRLEHGLVAPPIWPVLPAGGGEPRLVPLVVREGRVLPDPEAEPPDEFRDGGLLVDFRPAGDDHGRHLDLLKDEGRRDRAGLAVGLKEGLGDAQDPLECLAFVFRHLLLPSVAPSAPGREATSAG
jgi:hypothetical protein